MRFYKILIADDSSIDAERARRALSALSGAEITVVEDGAAALRAAKHTRFDLLLVDYEMPALNGLQLVRLLRGTWSRHELPILVLTVRDDVQTKVLSLRQGASDYVTKPVEPEELLARVQAHLDLRTAVEENIRARMQILEGRKQQIIGRLAGGVAHELNSPAQFTMDNLVFLQKALGGASELLERAHHEMGQPGPRDAAEFFELWRKRQLSFLLAEAPKALEEALSGVMRMARTVSELKEFAGGSEQDFGLSDLNRAIENTVHVSRQLWASAACVELRLDPELPRLACDVGALKQAFFNILFTLVEGVERSAAAPGERAQIQIETQPGESGVVVRFQGRGRGLDALAPTLAIGLSARDLLGIASDHPLALAHAVVVRQHSGELALGSRLGQDLAIWLELPWREPSSASSSRGSNEPA